MTVGMHDELVQERQRSRLAALALRLQWCICRERTIGSRAHR